MVLAGVDANKQKTPKTMSQISSQGTAPFGLCPNN